MKRRRDQARLDASGAAMQCPYCGNLVQQSAAKCDACGASLAEAHREQHDLRKEALESFLSKHGKANGGPKSIRERLHDKGFRSILLLVVIIVGALIALALQGDGDPSTARPPW
jgi:uncharacterized membrane protein YvbJ